jgi:hypothetical protein
MLVITLRKTGGRPPRFGFYVDSRVFGCDRTHQGTKP